MKSGVERMLKFTKECKLKILNIDKTFILNHAAPTCGENSIGNKTQYAERGPEWTMVKVLSMFIPDSKILMVTLFRFHENDPRIHIIGQSVAVKIINRRAAPDSCQRKFLPRELEVLRKLDHRNLIK